MAVTLTGPNQFALRLALEQLTADFVKEHGDIAVERLRGDELSFERLQESLQSSPFLASKKLVVLHEPSLNKQFMEQAERLLSQAPETTEIILVEPKLDKRSSYYKVLLKVTDFRNLDELDESQLS